MKKSFWKSGIIALCLVASMSMLASCGGDDKKTTDESKIESSTESKVETSSSEAASEEATSEEATSEEATSEEVTSEEVTSEEATSEEATSEETTSEDAPATNDYVVYTDGEISFEYPKGFTSGEQGGVKLVQDITTGNNITIASEAKNNIYHEMTEATFNTTLKAYFESMGMTITDFTHEVETNAKGEEIAILSFTNTYSGIAMKQVLFAVNTSDKTYVVTVTELFEDENLVKLVFDTLDALK